MRRYRFSQWCGLFFAVPVGAVLLALLVLSSSFLRQFWSALRRCWHGTARKKGALGAASLLVRNLWNFVHESTPERRRQRYGDMEFDWEHRVDTTSGTVEWRTRLLGLFGSPYQPTDPNLFHEMMSALAIDYQHFTFLDIGSGKGRTLLMASETRFAGFWESNSCPNCIRSRRRIWRSIRAPDRNASCWRLSVEMRLTSLFLPRPCWSICSIPCQSQGWGGCWTTWNEV